MMNNIYSLNSDDLNSCNYFNDNELFINKIKNNNRGLLRNSDMNKKAAQCKNIGLIINNYQNIYNFKIRNEIRRLINRYRYNVLNIFKNNFINDCYIDNLIKKLDGVILLSLLNDNEEYDNKVFNYFENNNSIPCVSIGKSFKNIPSIKIDYTEGFRKLILHLISEHRCKKLAFVFGSEENGFFNIRLKIYKKILKMFNIQFNPDLIYKNRIVENNESKIISSLIDIRKTKFDALIVSNNNIANNFIIELKNRKINVPDDVVVVSFDDIELADDFNQNITCIKYPFNKIIDESLNILLTSKIKKDQTMKKIFPSSLSVHNLNRCNNKSEQRKYKMNILRSIPHNSKLNNIDINLISKFILKMDNEFNNVFHLSKLHMWAEIIFTALINELLNNKNNIFIKNFKEILNQTVMNINSSVAWNNIIFYLFEKIIPELIINKNKSIVHKLLVECMIIQCKLLTDYNSSLRKNNMYMMNINIIEKKLKNTASIKDIHLIIKEHFHNLNIKSFYVFIFEEENDNNINLLKLFIAYKDYKLIDNHHNDQSLCFSEYLLSSIYDNKSSRFICSINSNNEPFGLIIYEIDENILELYELLFNNIGNCIKEIIIREKIKYQKEKNKKKPIKYSRICLNKNIIKRYCNKLHDRMRSEKLYLDQSLTLIKLSNRLKISRNHLSYIINSYLNTNFYNFINNFRIEDVKIKLKNFCKDESIIQLAYDSGFKCMSTFYKMFKINTGMTPIQYIKFVK